jgi:signal transduction histidine kinase/CheY-like chemotaxis protein
MPVRVEDIALPVRPVSPTTTASAVLSLFLSDPAVFAVPVISDGAALGHVTRARLTEALAGPQGREIYASRPIVHLLTPHPVMVEAGTPVALIAKLAADHTTSALTDGVIVLQDGRYLGLVSASAILTAVAQENTARARAMQNSNLRLEEARNRALEMARDKSRFLAFLGHEIRTPLTGILGVADLLQDAPSGTQTRQLARTISDSGHHLDRLLADLLDLSRLEAGKITVNPEPFDLHEFAAGARDLWQTRVDGKRLDLKLRVHAETAPRIEADAMRIRQILFNLISNALKFTDRGTIGVSLTTLEVAGQVQLKLEVSDTGCGISDADKARMFEAFEQARTSTAHTHGGTGLGLAIAKGLTRRMAGEISLADNPGGGSIFTVTLPVRRAGPRLAVQTAQKQRPRTLQLGRILIVEDHAVSALVITRSLTAAGWTVDAVESSEAAFLNASVNTYQAILADIHLPGEGGEALVRRLRGQPGPNQMSPILAVTADVSPERRASCARAGFTMVIEKPIRPRALVATLADVLIADAARWETGRAAG